MVEDLNTEIGREAIAEGIAHRCKMRNMLQQVITEEPAISNIYIALPPSLAQRWDTEQMPDENHFNKHKRVCTRMAHLVVVQRFQTLTQLVVVHDLLDFSEKMVFGYKHIDVNNHCFAAGIFSSIIVCIYHFLAFSN